ncbi:hypothetical protein IWW38_003425, partial [Coemansia aciculifera]
MYSAATITSTWEFLRSLYPPKQSKFAPLASAAANGDDYNYDIAFSQAATITTYAIELLHDATDSDKINRRCIRQANDLLATLCDTLITTRDELRNQKARASEQASENSRNARHKETGNRQQEGRVEGSGSGSKRRRHSHHRDCSLLVTSPQKGAQTMTPESAALPAASESQTVVEAISIEGPSDRDAISMENADDNNCDIETSVPATTSNQAPTLLPGEFGRRQVIRDAFLRHGLTESDVVTYFERYSKKANASYDRYWKLWAL